MTGIISTTCIFACILLELALELSSNQKEINFLLFFPGKNNASRQRNDMRCGEKHFIRERNHFQLLFWLGRCHKYEMRGDSLLDAPREKVYQAMWHLENAQKFD